MQAHLDEFRVASMCRVLGVQRSGFYAWQRQPHSDRHREDQRLLGMIKQAWLESGTVYGYRKVTDDLRDLGEACGKHRVARLMKQEGLQAQVGYGRRPRPRGGRVSTVAPNHLDRQFEVAAPNTHWVTDITYIRTHEGWLYLAVVLDLFARTVVGWSMSSRIDSDLVLKLLQGLGPILGIRRLLGVLRMDTQHRQGRAQFMGGIGEEALLARQQLSHLLQQAIERRHDRLQLLGQRRQKQWSQVVGIA